MGFGSIKEMCTRQPSSPPIPHPMAPPKYSKIAYNNICNPQDHLIAKPKSVT